MDSIDERTRGLLAELACLWIAFSQGNLSPAERSRHIAEALQLIRELIDLNPSSEKPKIIAYKYIELMHPIGPFGCLILPPVFIVLSVLLFCIHWSAAAAPAIGVIWLFFISKAAFYKAERRLFTSHGSVEDLKAAINNCRVCSLLLGLMPFAALVIIGAVGGMVVSIT